jgi:hypothetical protein
MQNAMIGRSRTACDTHVRARCVRTRHTKARSRSVSDPRGPGAGGPWGEPPGSLTLRLLSRRSPRASERAAHGAARSLSLFTAIPTPTSTWPITCFTAPTADTHADALDVIG